MVGAAQGASLELDMILIVDNYDSFTHNLYQLVRSCLLEAVEPIPRNARSRSARQPASGDPCEVLVIRNDAREVGDIVSLAPSHVILSPGPGHPRDAGLSTTLPNALVTTPILGVCLGHQALAHAAKAVVTRSPRPTHGQTVPILHDGSTPFETCPSPTPVALYHSLVVNEASLPDTIVVTARSLAGDVMALRHKARPHFGVQFHPESFLTPIGPHLMRNFLAT